MEKSWCNRQSNPPQSQRFVQTIINNNDHFLAKYITRDLKINLNLYLTPQKARKTLRRTTAAQERRSTNAIPEKWTELFIDGWSM